MDERKTLTDEEITTTGSDQYRGELADADQDDADADTDDTDADSDDTDA